MCSLCLCVFPPGKHILYIYFFKYTYNTDTSVVDDDSDDVYKRGIQIFCNTNGGALPTSV